MPGWLTDGIGGLIEKGLDAAMRWALKSLLSALQVVLDGISEWWLGITGPGMAEGSPAMAVQQNTIYFVAVAGMIGTAIGIIRVVRTQSKDASVDLVMAMFSTVSVTAIGGTAATYLLKVSDLVSPWLMTQITGQGEDERQGLYESLAIMPDNQSAKFVIGMAILSVILVMIAALASVVNAMFVIFSYGMIAVLVGLLPIFAAQSQTEAGKERFWKVIGWIFAAVLYKPTAAVIYGTGSLWIKGMVSEDQKGDAFGEMISLISGMVVICMACLALPALIRIVTVATTNQARGVGAGGAIAAGAGAVAIGSLGLAAAGAGAGSAGASGAASTGGAADGAASTGAESAGAESAGTGGSASSGGASGMADDSGGSSAKGSASGSGGSSSGRGSTSADTSSDTEGTSGSSAGVGGFASSASDSASSGSTGSTGNSGGPGSTGPGGEAGGSGSTGPGGEAGGPGSTGPGGEAGGPGDSGSAETASPGGEQPSAAPVGDSGGNPSSAAAGGSGDTGNIMSPNMARALSEAGRFTGTSLNRQLQELENIES